MPQASDGGLGGVTLVTAGGGTVPGKAVYLFCVWQPHAINTYCIAFSVEIVDFLSFSDHLSNIWTRFFF